MIQVLIIEDEPLAARRLERLLLKIEPNTHVLDVIDSVEDAVNWLSEHTADLIFMDIHLADGNSFNIFDLVEVHVPIIFATAYDQYAIRAFKHNSIDYLLKPIEEEELSLSLEKYNKSQLKTPAVDYQTLLSMMEQGPKDRYQQRFIVTSGDKIKSIKIQDVAYFFGQKKYVFLITHDNRRHIIDYTLGKLEELLDPDYFFRINRQFIISFDAIQHMYPYSKSRIKIDLNPQADIEVIVSIDKSRLFKDWLNR